jgi:hypothetical protein
MLMHKSLVLIVSSSVLGFVACSSASAPLGNDEDAGASSTTTDAGSLVDSGIDTTIDSGTIDTDSGVDSGPVVTGEFSCAGDPLPTTAPASITIAGNVADESISGQTPLDGVAISAYPSQTSTTPLANATSASGAFSIVVGTGGVPLDGYLKASKSGELDTYLYPNAPLAVSSSGLSVVMLTSSTYGFLAIGGGVTQDDTKGDLAVVVLDCNAQPVSGAIVMTSPAGTVRYSGSAGPSASAVATSTDGLAYVFNVAAGDVTVSATAGSVSLRSHHLVSRAGAFTTTLVTP